MSDATTYRCPYCRSESAGTGSSCPNCGAPVDIKLRTTTSGWTEIPPIADMARIQLGHSSCQIAGKFVPAAEVTLAAGDTVYFPHPSLLWQEPSVTVTAMSLRKAWTRMRAGLPLVMLQAAGPGRIAFSHDTAGELLAVPLQPGASVDVREHQMVAATGAVAYDWIESGIWFVTSGGNRQDEASGAKLLRMGLDVAGMGGDGRTQRNDETQWPNPQGQYRDRINP
ncbi:MAG: AIM24 family protein, partial [Acidimicrobiales bacterium]